MNLKTLSNSSLHEKLVSLTFDERKLGLEILEHLREVESRRLYAERGHSSLFTYAVTELKYSESAAQRRISAMRQLRELPELVSKVESGALKVTQLAQMQTFFRAEKQAGHSYTLKEKRELIESSVGKSTRETEKLLAEKNPESVRKESVRVITPSLTELRFTADEELMKSFQAIRDRFAHELPTHASLSDILKFMAVKTLKSAPENKSVSENQPVRKNPLPAPVVRSRYIPRAVKNEVWKRDLGKCVYVSKETGKKCGSPHRLQVDHITPYAKNGRSDDPANLRLLCFTHNQAEAIRVFGIARLAMKSPPVL